MCRTEFIQRQLFHRIVRQRLNHRPGFTKIVLRVFFELRSIPRSIVTVVIRQVRITQDDHSARFDHQVVKQRPHHPPDANASGVGNEILDPSGWENKAIEPGMLPKRNGVLRDHLRLVLLPAGSIA
jgi:hypothetical protein